MIASTCAAQACTSLPVTSTASSSSTGQASKSWWTHFLFSLCAQGMTSTSERVPSVQFAQVTHKL